MLNSKTSALGIIFPNSYDATVPELANVRLMASIPFASRYRMIDFVLSGMSNSGIDNISLLVNKNYHSLMDHLGSGREWDLVRKNGGLTLFPPNAEKTSLHYTGRISALEGIIDFLRSQKEEYVVMADANIAVNFDFAAMLDAHVASGADVTIAYNETELPDGYKKLSGEDSFYYTFNLEGDRITEIFVNRNREGKQNLSMSIFVLKRELLIEIVDAAFVRGLRYFERDVLMNAFSYLKMNGYKYDGYVARITSLKSYFDENMKLLDDANLNALFDTAPVYTKIRDDNPTRYIAGAKAENIMAADGCVIEGEVENSILFRGVKIEKGAKVKNCILMQDTVVKAGADIEYIITDKNAVVSELKTMRGTDTYPIYVTKHATV
ncbi:MAG: glucose-1-phosphate adenylyltransferase subunit GlgD [Lachnospiraceae bacterium]|nr:glucose-1-phosphate adenylyltransferase subunit GlgD [Lachnospiraceae bacterium]